ncbi:MAG: DMT family transporter [Planctomycetales bacterium]|nr:DMT family transporter [Planctomycetales bacterium]
MSVQAPPSVPQTMDTRVASGVTLAIVGAFLFALKSIFIKLAFASGTDATTLLTLRLTFALPFYVAMLVHLRRQGGPRPISGRVAVGAVGLGFLGYYLSSYLDMAGLEFISAQLERLTLFTYPAMIAVLAWLFLGEPLSPRILVAIAMCYGGIFTMYSQERTWAGGDRAAWGIALVIGSALSYSFYVMFAKKLMQRTGSREFTCLAMLGSTLFALLHFGVTHSTADLRLPAPVWVYGAVLAFVCTVIPSFLVNEAIMRIGATRTTIIGTIGPVVTMVLAIAVLREPSSPWHFAGMALVLLGVSMVARKT